MLAEASCGIVIAFLFRPWTDGAQGDEGLKSLPWAEASVMMPQLKGIRPCDDLTAHLFSASRTAPSTVYGDYAPRVRFNVDELAANRDNFLKKSGPSLKSTKPLTMDGRKGLEFTGENAQATFKSRVFIFGTRFYQIAVAILRGKDDAENSNRFFASFEFTRAEVRPKR